MMRRFQGGVPAPQAGALPGAGHHGTLLGRPADYAGTDCSCCDLGRLPDGLVFSDEAAGVS